MITREQSLELQRLAGLWATARVRKAVVAHGCGCPRETPQNTAERERKANAEFHQLLRALTLPPAYVVEGALSDAEFVRLAHEQYHRDGEIEIDSTAIVSRGDEPISGAHVQAWVWVDLPEENHG